MSEKEENEYEDEWWYHRSKRFLRFFDPLLRATSRQYREWKFLNKPPEKRRKAVEARARKIRKQSDFPKATKQDVVGRDEDFDRVFLSAYYHVLRNPEIRKSTPVPPPKIFIIKGDSGSGKTYFAEACQREVFEAGLQSATLVKYGSLTPEEVYSRWYGSSAQRLGGFFEEAFQSPSTVFIDEFQAFGAEFTSSSEVGMEEKRVQTVLLEKFDELEKKSYRTLLFLSTNNYETITDTLRRRALVGTIDLDLGTNRLVLIEICKRQCQKYGVKVDPTKIVESLEDALSAIGNTRLSPADVVNAFSLVLAVKSKPIQESILSGEKDKKPLSLQDLVKDITLDDFRAQARSLKSYTLQAKTEAAKSSITRIAPKTRYRDVGGLHGIREEIIKEISLSLDSNLAVKAGYFPPKGFLFYGSPGTGKTLLAKAIAGENDVWFYEIDGPSILQGHYGDPEKTIRDIFADARKNAPAIIFFDEIDSIATMRGTSDPVVDRVVSQLLTQIDGFTPLTNVVVIGATNRKEILDPALLDRFTSAFEFSFPRNEEEKLEIIEIHLRRYRDFLAPEVTSKDVLRVFEKKILSPRRIADTIDDANRLRTKELEAGHKYFESLKYGPEKAEETRKLYGNDFERVCELAKICLTDSDAKEKLEQLDSLNYPLRIYHFEKALEEKTDKSITEIQQMVQKTVRLKKPKVGRSYGLIALGEGGESGGLVGVVEVVVNPNGSGKIHVIGSEAGESILSSAEDAYVCIDSLLDWKFKTYDVYVELVTPAKGMEKQVIAGMSRPPVSGPSAGLAIAIAMLSAFTNEEVDPTIVMTGAITAGGEVWPVGGLDYRGMGKIEAALSDEFARKLIVPKYNYDQLLTFDVEKTLLQKGISVVPVENFLDAVAECIPSLPKFQVSGEGKENSWLGRKDTSPN